MTSVATIARSGARTAARIASTGAGIGAMIVVMPARSAVSAFRIAAAEIAPSVVRTGETCVSSAANPAATGATAIAAPARSVAASRVFSRGASHVRVTPVGANSAESAAVAEAVRAEA